MIALWGTRRQGEDLAPSQNGDPGVRQVDSLRVIAAAGAIIYLLAARLVWMHYLVLALPVAVLLLGPEQQRAIRAAAAVSLTMLSRQLWLPILHIRTHEAESRLIAAGLLILWIAALASLLRRSRHGAPALGWSVSRGTD